MPMSHKDLWVKIRRECKGKPPAEELRILEGYLSDWPEYKGPYQELGKKLARRAEELRKVRSVLATHSVSTDPFSVRKRGLAEVALIGLPNVGKTSLFTALTGAEANIADYPYTTLTPNVGMLNVGGFEFEIVDLPAFPDGELAELHFAGGLKEAVLNAGLACLVIDLRGDHELQLDILSEHLRGIGADGLDAIVVGTHADDAGQDEVERLSALVEVDVFAFPLAEGRRRAVGEALCDLMGKIVVDARDPATREEPTAYAMSEGATVLDLAGQIHKDLAKTARRAKVWGPSAKFDGQEVGLDHVLSPGDVVEIHTR